eukprot:764651-Hanusia_phi.AAC.1
MMERVKWKVSTGRRGAKQGGLVRVARGRGMGFRIPPFTGENRGRGGATCRTKSALPDATSSSQPTSDLSYGNAEAANTSEQNLCFRHSKPRSAARTI